LPLSGLNNKKLIALVKLSISFGFVKRPPSVSLEIPSMPSPRQAITGFP